MDEPPASGRLTRDRRALARATATVEAVIDRPTRRRAGVFRRAIRREVSRLHDRRRLLAIALLVLTFGILGAGLIARGDLAGADARAYWAGVRIWLSGGDPYSPVGPFLPYVYAPWMLPLFAPWALLPWDVAWFLWRGGSILAVLWTVEWAYRRRPLPTAVLVALLAFPMGANLDTGNINVVLILAIWATQFSGPRVAGLLWGLSTWMKWAPAVFWIVLRPRARLWGLAFLAGSALLSLATLPLTIAQLETLVAQPRPLRLDFLAYAWAFVPWLWRRADPLFLARPSWWRRAAAGVAARAAGWVRVLRADPDAGARAARREVAARLRSHLGIEA